MTVTLPSGSQNYALTTSISRTSQFPILTPLSFASFHAVPRVLLKTVRLLNVYLASCFPTVHRLLPHHKSCSASRLHAAVGCTNCCLLTAGCTSARILLLHAELGWGSAEVLTLNLPSFHSIGSASVAGCVSVCNMPVA